MRQEVFQLVDERYLSIEKWRTIDQNLLAGISTRVGGVSKPPYASLNLGLHVGDKREDVIKNRKRLAESLTIDVEQLVCCEQIHESTIQKVKATHTGLGVFSYENALEATDGVYTAEKNVFLALAFADCVPIYFFAPNHHLIGLVHAGWKGTVKKIAPKMIERWTKQEQIPIEDIFVAIGPSIGGVAYEVDETVIHAVNEAVGTTNESFYQSTKNGHFLLDLKKVNVELLRQAGVLNSNIEVSTYCTSCQNDLFFSHRKENGKTGRMLAFIGYK